MAAHDETGGTGFFDKPGMRAFMAQLGLGLIMGGMPQRYGTSRGQAMSPYFQRAVKGMFPSEDTKLKRRYLKGQIGEMESKAEKRESQARSRRDLLQWYRTQKALRRFRTVQQPGAAPPLAAAPQPQPWPPGPGGPQAGPPVPTGAPPTPAAGGLPMRGSSGRIPPALLLGAFGAEALPHLMKSRKGFTLSPGQTRYGPQGGEIASVPGVAKPVEYGKPMTVRQGDKDVLARFSKTGRAPPLLVEGYGPAQRPDKDSRTAVQKNVPYLAKVMGISEKDAAALVTQSRSMSPQQFRQKVFLAYMSSWDATAEEAAKQADAAMKLFYPQTAPAAPQGPTPPAGGGGLLSNLYRSFNPSAGAATPSGGRTPPPTERQKRRGAEYSVGETVTIGGKSYEVIEPNPDGTVTIMDLATGQRHFAR